MDQHATNRFCICFGAAQQYLDNVIRSGSVNGLALASLQTAADELQSAANEFEPNVRDAITAVRTRLANKGTDHSRIAN